MDRDEGRDAIAPAGLTPREVDVLGLIGTGLTNQEIAERLYVSINTVKTYIRCAYQKIGAQRRTQAVIWVRQNGLAAPGRPMATDDRMVRPAPRSTPDKVPLPRRSEVYRDAS